MVLDFTNNQRPTREPKMQWPTLISDFAEKFRPVFTKPTLQRMGDLLCGALVKKGKRTFTSILAFILPFVKGHWSNFYRLFSRPAWSNWSTARVIATLLMELVPQDQRVVIVADGTVNEHPGRKVYGKGKHRDAVHSSQSFTAYKWGHRWIVLAVAVSIPGITRAWALPLVMALSRPPEVSEAENRTHKKPVVLLRQLMNILRKWFPDRPFVLVVDGEFSSHHLAGWARKHCKTVTLIGRFYGDACLYSPPPTDSGKGRPRQKGDKLPKPEERVTEQKSQKKTVSWYGGGQRRVGLRSGVGLWYRSGQGLAWLRWVHVEDLEKTHRPDYFFCTDGRLSMQQIVEYYTMRWSLEVTFEESRAHLGWGSRRVRVKDSVLRSDPWLLMLYSVVSYLYLQLLKAENNCPVMSFPWYKKEEATFSDALLAVRGCIWEEWLLHTPEFSESVQKLSPECRQFLLFQLTMSV